MVPLYIWTLMQPVAFMTLKGVIVLVRLYIMHVFFSAVMAQMSGRPDVVCVRMGQLMACRRGRWYITACVAVILLQHLTLSTRHDSILPTFRSSFGNMSTVVLEGLFEDATMLWILCYIILWSHIYSERISVWNDCNVLSYELHSLLLTLLVGHQEGRHACKTCNFNQQF